MCQSSEFRVKMKEKGKLKKLAFCFSLCFAAAEKKDL